MIDDKIYAVVSEGIVINKIVWNGDKAKWASPETTYAVEITQPDVDVGFIYNKRKKTFSPSLK